MNTDAISSLLGALPLPAVLIGRGERVLGANALAGKLLGDGLVGRHFITALRQPAILDAIEGSLRDRIKRKTRYLSNDASQDTAFDVTCSPVQTDAGQGVLVCFEDVANVSHELRSPLTSLLGFIETLQGPALGDKDTTARFLEIMTGEATRMERLVRDLLSLSRVEEQMRVRPTDRVNLSDIIVTVMHALKTVAEDQNVSVVTDLPETPIIVPGDGDQLQQVVTNLLENAIKYGGRDKKVFLQISITDQDPTLRGPAAMITVEDQGPGIDQVHIPRLTERFYRVDNHRSREVGGTGLGLAIVKHIIGRHRGRLRIESALGEGAKFRVVLPTESHDLTRSTSP